MKKRILFMGAIALSAFTFAQTGVGVMTENPQGTFHVDGSGDNATSGTPTTAQQANDFTVLGDGKVGVGTTAPTQKFEVVGGRITVENIQSTSGYGVQMEGLNGYGEIQGFNWGIGPAILAINPNGGNVGIGTTTPNTKLEVFGNEILLHPSSSSANQIALLNGYGLRQGLVFASNGSASNTSFGVINTQQALHFSTAPWNVGFNSDLSTDWTPRMTVASNGNVGIGTTSPTQTLDVQGTTKTVSLLGPSTTNFHIDAQSTQNIWLNYSSGSGGVHIGNGAGGYGQAYAAAFNVSSDARLKTNIVPMNNGLNTVMRLNPVSYDKKASLTSTDYTTHEYGFLAQELQKVLPTLVGEGNDAGHTLSVNYVAIIPVLVKAIQEQQAQIEALKAKK